MAAPAQSLLIPRYLDEMPFSVLRALENENGIEIHNKKETVIARRGYGDLIVHRFPGSKDIIPGTEDLVPCTKIESLHAEDKVVIILQCRNIINNNEFAIPFIYGNELNSTVNLKTHTPIFIKTNILPYLLCNEGTRVIISIAELEQLVKNGRVYCNPYKEIQALGAVAPNSRSGLSHGPYKGIEFPNAKSTEPDTDPRFKRVLGFAAPFLRNFLKKGGKKIKHTKRVKRTKKITRRYKKN